MSFIALSIHLATLYQDLKLEDLQEDGSGHLLSGAKLLRRCKAYTFKLSKTVQVSSRPPLSRLFSDPETTLRLNPENCEAVGEASSQALVCNSVIICIPRPRSERIPFYQPQAE